jgi:L-2,4-diaminobutyrate decarboxylase
VGTLDSASTARVALDALERYGRASRQGDGPAIAVRSLDDLVERLELRRWLPGGGMDEHGFARFLDRYLAHTTRMEHPGYLSHQVAPPDWPSALADLVHGRVNNVATTYELGPAAAAVEIVVVDWMLDKIGFRPGGAGVLTHGGSLGNLTGLLAARARAVPDSWTRGTPPGLAVLVSESAHYSVRRAVAILGLGEDAIVRVESDDVGRVLPSDLDAAVERAAAAGRRPIALVATACSTATGLHDDLRAMGTFCRERGLWLHVDGAHGVSALLSARHRRLLDGLELADSVVWDAHKMMRTSAMCTGVLFRRAEDLAHAFHQEASYLMYEDGVGADLSVRSFETTKAPVGLKLFLNIAWRGEGGLGSYVARQYDKTRRFHRLIEARPEFECPYEPESNILCFRYRAGDDELHREVRRRLAEEGDFVIAAADLGGRRWFRLTVMSPETDEAEIERLLDEIERIAASCEAPPVAAVAAAARR